MTPHFASASLRRASWQFAVAACLLIGISALAANAAPQARTASDWLVRMNQALSTENYRGVFTYMHGGSMSTLRITHAVLKGVPHERLVHMDGMEREIIRIGDDAECVLQPEDELVELTESIPAGPFAKAFAKDFSELPGEYQLKLGDPDRIAGRDAQILEVLPSDQYRFGYRLWLDQASGLLLKSELLGSDGNPLEVFQFGDIEIGKPVDAALFHVPADARKVTHRLTLGKPSLKTERVQWRADWVPSGFEMASWDLRRGSQSLPALNALMYSDGLAALSIFIEQASDQHQPGNFGELHLSRQGATVAASLDAQDAQGRLYLITVVGEVPDATAERIAKSVMFAAPMPAD